MGSYVSDFCIPHKMEDKYSSFHPLLSYLHELGILCSQPLPLPTEEILPVQGSFILFNSHLLVFKYDAKHYANTSVNNKKEKRMILAFN